MQQELIVETQTESALQALQVERKNGFEALGAALRIKAQPSGKRKTITTVDEAEAERARRAATRKALADYPCIWPHLRLMLSGAEAALIQAAGSNEQSAEGQVMSHVLESMRVDLGHQQAPVLEQILIEHVVLTWLDLDTVQRGYAQHLRESHTLTLGAYWDRRINGAQHRYLRAVETLARVRRLAQVIPLQVNIGGQQVNVAGMVRMSASAAPQNLVQPCIAESAPL